MDEFTRIPPVPDELVNAAEAGMLVVFVGAGISRLVGCPSWNGFADAVINQLVPEAIDYHEKSLINSIADPRKRLSIARIIQEERSVDIDYKAIFYVDNPRSNIYQFINKFNCNFVTTNYDKLLIPEISASKPAEEWRFFNIKDILRDKLDDQGNVLHLHGCVDNSNSMVITTKNYLDHYASEEIPEFLSYLFESKTVLFLGYGLEEIEILEYILKASNQVGSMEKHLFILQGFFNAEMSLFEKLKKYYDQSFNAELIGFPKDFNDYEHQKDILEKWSAKLSFGSVAVVDELAAMEEELSG